MVYDVYPVMLGLSAAENSNACKEVIDLQIAISISQDILEQPSGSFSKSHNSA